MELHVPAVTACSRNLSPSTCACCAALQIDLYRDTRESIQLATRSGQALKDMQPAARERAFQREMKAENNLHPAMHSPQGHYLVGVLWARGPCTQHPMVGVDGSESVIGVPESPSAQHRPGEIVWDVCLPDLRTGSTPGSLELKNPTTADRCSAPFPAASPACCWTRRTSPRAAPASP